MPAERSEGNNKLFPLREYFGLKSKVVYSTQKLHGLFRFMPAYPENRDKKHETSGEHPHEDNE